MSQSGMLPPNFGAERKRRRARTLAYTAGVGAFLLAGLVFFGRWGRAPDLYDPERISVVEAERLVSQAYSHRAQQKELQKQIEEAHLALKRAILRLQAAENLDSAHGAILDDLQVQLGILADDRQVERMSPKELRDAYDELDMRLEGLIKKLGRKEKTSSPEKG